MKICLLLLTLSLAAGLAHGHGRPASRVPVPPLAAQPAAAQDTTAEKMLAFQRSGGGWPKAVNEVKVDYRHRMNDADLAAARRGAGQEDATIDNNATTREITYLVSAFKATQNPAYRQAAERGIGYLLKMQQPSGGFPQYYPDARFYRAQITYNDNAMIRALEVLKAVAEKKNDFALVDASLIMPAQKAVDRGVQCILKTQYVQHGKLTAWGAQHDRTTLLPCKARAFELASLSGDESVGITEFLLSLDQPSPEVRKAIAAAVAWFQASKIENTAVQDLADPSQPKGRDRVMVPQAGSTVWARFYDLDTNKPIYVGRDGVKHDRLADIEVERRTGYVYAGTWPEKLLARDYPKWQQKWGAN
ncbi:pectate lyase [Hymenobacter cheonanensis]|uniref:pectate lyase n=1 Tax=Hymenobacter sp. CA2-7 TaxID=3063993 RepID=UPI0027136031|nr:pectate lyase [Hymenobacter sp. CA2-7]MDO7886674.1 pectate lyase [Hymenobacter sp. CA2-7]